MYEIEDKISITCGACGDKLEMTEVSKKDFADEMEWRGWSVRGIYEKIVRCRECYRKELGFDIGDCVEVLESGKKGVVEEIATIPESLPIIVRLVNEDGTIRYRGFLPHELRKEE